MFFSGWFMDFDGSTKVFSAVGFGIIKVVVILETVLVVFIVIV